MASVGYLLVALTLVVYAGAAAPPLMRVKNKAKASVANTGDVEIVSEYKGAARMMHTKHTGEVEIVSQSKAKALAKQKPIDQVKDWLKKFQKDDCSSVSSALSSAEAIAVQNANLCDDMFEGLGICIEGCPGMGFRCLKRMSCELANDTTAENKIKTEAAKVCTKMETVAQESADEAECTVSSLSQHRTGQRHTSRAPHKGKGQAIQDRYLSCFPDSTDPTSDNDDYDTADCGGNSQAATNAYSLLGSGWCEDYKYLPGLGEYPSLLSSSDPQYSSDRIRECMNRCLSAASSDSAYGNAFYTNPDNQCVCSKGACPSRKNWNGANAYQIIQASSSLLGKMSIRASSSLQTSDRVLDESLTGKELC